MCAQFNCLNATANEFCNKTELNDGGASGVSSCSAIPVYLTY